MIKLENEKIRSEKYYSVGFDKENNRYLLSVVITWVAWFKRYYLISNEEYDWYDTNLWKLDLLAEECYNDKTSSERFVYSEREDENKNTHNV